MSLPSPLRAVAVAVRLRSSSDRLFGNPVSCSTACGRPVPPAAITYRPVNERRAVSMTLAPPNRIELPPEPATDAGPAELVPMYIDPELVVTPDDNPAYTPAMLADLTESIRHHGQLVPGWMCPSPDLPESQRLCLEGNHRLAVARTLGRRFWAFDLGRFVPEEERIRLLFAHHGIRRQMSREEIAERAARWIEITGATQADAAKVLGVSGPTLSRAFGERRIPESLKPRADLLGLSIRSLVAAAPAALMSQAVEFALTPRADGKMPTRDQVSACIQQLKKRGVGQPQGRKPKTVTLRVNGRAVTLAVEERDSASTVAEDLKSLATRLGRLTDVAPGGWPFLFQ
jgi:ParB-like chromosome segregation protein Spo0J